MDVVYIIWYITKAEKEMGLLLQNAQGEATKQDNVNAKEALKHLGIVIAPPTGNRKSALYDKHHPIHMKFSRCGLQLMYNSMMFT